MENELIFFIDLIFIILSYQLKKFWKLIDVDKYLYKVKIFFKKMCSSLIHFDKNTCHYNLQTIQHH